MTIELSQWMPPTPISVLWLVLAALLILLLTSWLIGRRHYTERGKQIILAFDDSTISHAALSFRPSPSGFEMHLEPAPDPFVVLRVGYRTAAAFNPLAWTLQLLAPSPEQLLIQANLPASPEAELIWHRDQAPDAALGRSRDSALWTLRRLDFVDAEYVTRGPLTNGVQHIFGELQTRYGPFLQHVVVQAGADADGSVDDDAHLTVVLDAARFDPAQASKLLTLVLAMGRAAKIG